MQTDKFPGRPDQEVRPPLTRVELDLVVTAHVRHPALFAEARRLIKPEHFDSVTEKLYKLVWVSALSIADAGDGSLPAEGAAPAIYTEIFSRIDRSQGAIILDVEETTEFFGEPDGLLARLFRQSPADMPVERARQLRTTFLTQRTYRDMHRLMARVQAQGHTKSTQRQMRELMEQVDTADRSVNFQQMFRGAFDPTLLTDPPPDDPIPWPTSLPFIDEPMCGGQCAGELYTLMGPTGVGKCVSLYTKILLYSGRTVLAKDIVVGDLLMGPDSKPRRVLSTITGREQMYRIDPTKGDSYTVNESHILSLKLTPDGPGQKHQLLNISVHDYLRANTTFKHRAKGWRTGVEFPAQPVQLDPYFLGIWLGDGDTMSPLVTTPDPEVVAYMRGVATSYGLTLVRVKDCGKASRYSLRRPRGTEGSGSANGLIQVLKELNVWGNKHIPAVYLANARDVRLQLLAGLLDADGYLVHNCIEYSSVRETLAEGVCFLARSLGLAAYTTAKRKACVKPDGSRVWGTYYYVIISGDIETIPFRVERRKPAPRKQLKNVLVTGITVTPVGEGDYCGWELDGDGLFLLGDFTVTHNTTLALQMAIQSARQQVLIASRDPGFTAGSSLFFTYEQDHNKVLLKAWSFAAEIMLSRKDAPKWSRMKDELSGRRPDGRYVPLKKYEYTTFAAEIQGVGGADKYMGEMGRLDLAMATLERKGLHIIDMTNTRKYGSKWGSGGIQDILAAIRYLTDEGGRVGAVYIDYAGLLVDNWMAENNKPASDKRHNLKGLGMDLTRHVAIPYACPVWLLHQVNTAGNRRSPTAVISHTEGEESGQIAQNAVFAFQLGTKDAETNSCRIYCTKTRGGPAVAEYPILKIEGQFSRLRDASLELVADEGQNKLVSRTQFNSRGNGPADREGPTSSSVPPLQGAAAVRAARAELSDDEMPGQRKP